MEEENQKNKNLLAIPNKSLNRYSNRQVIARGKIINSEVIPHISLEEVKRIAAMAGLSKNGYRDRLICLKPWN